MTFELHGRLEAPLQIVREYIAIFSEVYSHEKEVYQRYCSILNWRVDSECIFFNWEAYEN